MEASKRPSRPREVDIAERLGLFVAPSLQDALAPAPDADKSDVRSIVSRRIERGSGGLARRLALEEEAAAAAPEYIVDSFSPRARFRRPAARNG